MIKKITQQQLQPGMFVHDLNCDWLSHPFLRKRFLLKDQNDLDKIISAGIRELYIDTSAGLDVADAPTQTEVASAVHREMVEVAQAHRSGSIHATAAEEMERAKKVYEKASRIARDVMRDARLGKAVDIEGVTTLVDEITASVARNSGALISLLRLKDADNYTFLHCVAVGTLMVTFARSLGLDAETVRQAGLGGLLHDVGKMQVPDAVLNKPGKLTDEEFALIKRHPGAGHALLVATGSVGPIPLDITLHHHERIDGTGYPDRLSGDQITLLSKMAAVVDVYDAITSDRCYHKGIPPTDALRKLFEWSKFHFEERLVHQFMSTIGIYPVGTLVRLESGRLAVVMEQTDDNLLRPKVKIVFSAKSNCYVRPEILDLSRAGAGHADKIISHESPEKWQIDPHRFV